LRAKVLVVARVVGQHFFRDVFRRNVFQQVQPEFELNGFFRGFFISRVEAFRGDEPFSRVGALADALVTCLGREKSRSGLFA
jgi:hypothetical protein